MEQFRLGAPAAHLPRDYDSYISFPGFNVHGSMFGAPIVPKQALRSAL
jgi:hypothetical protein